MTKTIAAQLVGVHNTLSLQESNEAQQSFLKSEKTLSHFRFSHQDRLTVHKQTIDHMSAEEARSFSEGLLRALKAKPWRWKYAKQQHKGYWGRVAVIADYARSKSFIKGRVPSGKDLIPAG